MRPKHRISAAFAVALSAALAACGGAEQDAPRPSAEPPAAAAAPPASQVPAPGAGTGDTVHIKTFIFRPKPLRVPAGTTVTFRNLDATPHTVTAGTRAKPDRAAFDAKLAASDGTFRHRFDKPGTYAYFCDLHSGDGMVGKVVVE